MPGQTKAGWRARLRAVPACMWSEIMNYLALMFVCRWRGHVVPKRVVDGLAAHGPEGVTAACLRCDMPAWVRVCPEDDSYYLVSDDYGRPEPD